MTLRAIRLTLIGFFLATLFACRSAPPSSIRTALGEVRAATEVEAMRVADISASLQAELLALVPDSHPAQADLWVYPDEVFGKMHANTGIAGLVRWPFPGRFFGVNPRIELPRRSFEHSCAHEWVHLILGPSWHSLSGAIEEGLANELASQLTPPKERSQLRFGYICAALRRDWPEEQLTFKMPNGKTIRVRRKKGPTEEVGPALSIQDVLREPKIRKQELAKRPGSLRLYGLGTLLAERIAQQPGGLRDLHAACAEVPRGSILAPEKLLELADFGSGEDFEDWLQSEFTAAVPGAFLTQPDAFAGFVAELERLAQTELEMEVVLSTMEPTYQIGESEVFQIAEENDLRRLFMDNWPARERVDAIKASRIDEPTQSVDDN